MRTLVRSVIALLFAVLVLVGAIAAFVATFDLDAIKPRIALAVRDATGRQLAIDGPITVAWSLAPTIAAERLRLANVADGSAPEMLTLDRAEATLSLPALLQRTVVVRSLRLIRPKLLLETNAEGRPNWRFSPAVATPPLPASPPSADVPAGRRAPLFDLAVNDVSVEGGTVVWRNGTTGVATTVGVPRLTVQEDEATAPVRLAGDLSFRGRAVRLTAQTGGSAYAREDRPAASFPITARLSMDGAAVGVGGTLADPGQARGFVGRLTADSPDPSALAAIVPELAGTSRLRDVHVVATIIAPDDPIAVAVTAFLDDDPLTVEGHVTRPAPNALAFTGLHVLVPAVDLMAEGRITLGPHPALKVSVVAAALDLDGLRRMAVPMPNSAPAAPPPSAVETPVPAPPKTALSDAPISFESMRALDADVAITAARLRVGGLSATDLTAHLALANGKLRLDPARATLAGGPVALTATADATAAPAAVSLSVRAPALDAHVLTEGLLGVPDPLQGHAELFADLTSAGVSPHALAAALNGSVGVAMVDGSLDSRVIGQLAGAAANSLGLTSLLTRVGRSAVRCVAVRFDVKNGVGDSRALLIDTTPVMVEGGGSIDLGAETLALRLRPLARLGGAGVSVPVTVAGPWRRPSVSTDVAPTPTPRVNAAVGLVIGALAVRGAGGPDPCIPALALARDNQPGAPPPPRADAKPPKPGDALRSLLR